MEFCVPTGQVTYSGRQLFSLGPALNLPRAAEDLLQVAHQGEPHPLQPSLGVDAAAGAEALTPGDLLGRGGRGGRGDPAGGGTQSGKGSEPGELSDRRFGGPHSSGGARGHGGHEQGYCAVPVALQCHYASTACLSSRKTLRKVWRYSRN